MLRRMRDRHRQLMAEMAALDAKEEGIEAAQIVSPPAEKVSPGKILFLLAGLGAVTWYFAFSDHSPFKADVVDDKKPPQKDEPGSAKHILEQIKFGQVVDQGDSK